MDKVDTSNNKYVDFVDDEHLISCIANLHKAYLKAKKVFTKRKFYKNKVDTFKLTFDANFNNLTEEELIKLEMSRQIDKSVNNAIGAFHEEVLGGIKGFVNGKLSGYDIKSEDESLFADIKNKHNTMNSSSAESLFQKLARYADEYKNAKCYWVQILATKSFNENWFSIINGKEYSHSRVFKISGDQFYALLTGNKSSFYDLYKALPKAIDDYLASIADETGEKESIVEDIAKSAKNSGRSLIDEITFENFYYYDGFDNL